METEKIKKIIDALESDPNSVIFQEPVDHINLGLTDYLLIIKQPMDLSTIKKKINSKKYINNIEVLQDMNLIWENCKLYNQAGSDIYQTATYMEKLSKKLIEKYLEKKKNEKVVKKEESDTNSLLPYTDRALLCERIRIISNEGLASLVRLIEKVMPEAVNNISDPGKIEINLTIIDRKLYDEINLLIDTYEKLSENNKNCKK